MKDRFRQGLTLVNSVVSRLFNTRHSAHGEIFSPIPRCEALEPRRLLCEIVDIERGIIHDDCGPTPIPDDGYVPPINSNQPPAPQELPPPQPDPQPEPNEWYINLVVMHMTDAVEEDPGKFMPVNSDFNEENKNSAGAWVPDNQPDAVYWHRIVSGDEELRPARLHISPPASNTEGTWSINFPSKIRMWMWKPSQSQWIQVANGSGATQTFSSSVTYNFLIEGMSPSLALRDVTITAAVADKSDRAKLTVVDVDADVDSDNNNGTGNPGQTHAEERLEDAPDEPGKILTVNDGDVDNDGIPDFADGYSLYDGDGTELNGVSFVPYLLDLRGFSFSTDARLGFFYSYSAPHLVTRTGDGTPQDPYVYTPGGSGSLRLWTKNANERTSSEPLRDGGQYVAPHVEYNLSEFTQSGIFQTIPGVYRLWLEAVRPTPVPQMIHVFVDPDGPGNAAGFEISDKLRIMSFTTRSVRVEEDGTLTPTDTIEASHPSPVFSNVSINVQNLRFSPDYKRILGDLAVSGNLDDAASDLIPGDEGKISTVHVLLNGKDQPVGSVSTSISKQSDQPSLLAPHDFSATFSAVLPEVELQPGWNRIELSATNIYGFGGFAEQSVEVILTPPAATEVLVVFSDDPYLNSNATADLIYRSVGGAWSNPVTLTRVGPFEDHRFVNGAFALDFEAMPVFDPTISDHRTAVVSLPINGVTERGIDFWEQGPHTWILKGSYDPQIQATDFEGFSKSLGSSSPLLLSDGGDITRYTIEWVGASSFAGNFELATQTHLFDLVEVDGHLYWKLRDSVVPTVGIMLPTATPFVNEFPEDELTVLGATQFTAGVVVGFGKGVGNMVVGLVELVKAIPGAVSGAAVYTAKLPIRWSQGDTFDQERQLFRKVRNVTGTAADVIAKIWQNDDAVIAAIQSGDYEPLNEISVEMRLAVEFAVELFEELDAEVVGMSEFEKGKLVGQVLYEIVSTIIPLSKLGKVTKLKVLTELGNKPLFSSAAGPARTAYNKLLGAQGLMTKLQKWSRGDKVYQRLISRAEKIARQNDIPDTDPAGKFKAFIERTQNHKHVFDEALHLFAFDTSVQMYAQAVTGTTVDLTKLRTCAQLDEIRLLAGGRMGAAGIDIHHVAAKQWALVYLKNTNPAKYADWPYKVEDLTLAQEAVLNSMPGVLLNKIQHGTLGKGMGGFHQILRQETASLGPGSNPGAVVAALDRAYGRWASYLEPDHVPLGEKLFLAAKKWLEEEATRP